MHLIFNMYDMLSNPLHICTHMCCEGRLQLSMDCQNSCRLCFTGEWIYSMYMSVAHRSVHAYIKPKHFRLLDWALPACPYEHALYLKWSKTRMSYRGYSVHSLLGPRQRSVSSAVVVMPLNSCEVSLYIFFV